MQSVRTIIVRALWDSEAKVWVASSDDVPGLITEAETQEELFDKVLVMIPELLDDDDGDANGVTEVPLILLAEHHAKVRLCA